MQLWACVLKNVRRFVNDVTQRWYCVFESSVNGRLTRSSFPALAAARPRLKLQTFERFYSTMKQCRESFAEALLLLRATSREPPEQKRVLQYCMDFMLAQAHRIVLWRCSDEQLERARTAPASIGQDDYETYKVKLQILRHQSTEEAFQAARRIMRTIGVSHCLSERRTSHLED